MGVTGAPRDYFGGATNQLGGPIRRAAVGPYRRSSEYSSQSLGFNTKSETLMRCRLYQCVVNFDAPKHNLLEVRS